MEKLRSVRGKCFALTGRCWLPRRELEREIESARGRVSPGAKVTRFTDALVRGQSDQFAFGEFGLKEAAAAKLIREGRQLLVVHDYEFRKLLEEGKPARCSEYVAGQPIAWLKPPPRRRVFDGVARFEGSLDEEHSVLGRAEQGFLRAWLFQGKSRARCSLCGHEFPVELMFAAHIKPRAECSLEERRDACHIAFAVCVLGCDALYEKGFVSVTDVGCVVTATGGDVPAELKRRLRAIEGRRCQAWDEGNAKYFDWHYARRFRGQGSHA